MTTYRYCACGAKLILWPGRVKPLCPSHGLHGSTDFPVVLDLSPRVPDDAEDVARLREQWKVPA